MQKNIAKNETFDFRCRICGTCCRDDREIILNPQDVYNLTRKLGLSTAEFIEKYCQREDAPFAGLPLLTLSTVEGKCILLEGDLCAIHDARPACCRNYPLGTIFDPGGGEKLIIMDPAQGCLGFENGDSLTPEIWLHQSGIDKLAPGIALLRNAYTLATTRRNDPNLADRLFAILYNFDPIPDPSAPADFPQPLSPESAMSILRLRLLDLMFQD